MTQMSCFNLVAMVIVSNCVVGHEISANTRRREDGPLQSEPNTDQRNTFKDRFGGGDKIVFDRGEFYDRTTVPSMTINSNLAKTNVTSHQYSGKANGEYEFSLTIRNGIRRVESGDFEQQNGKTVFVVRGFFEHITYDGAVKVTAYVFDHTGYHEIPVTTDSEGVADFLAPSQGVDCDFSKGVYCIDRKLLSLLVG